MKNLVVLASGTGSNFQAIIDSVGRGDIQANISGLIASRPGIGAIEKAKSNQIPVYVLPSSDESAYEQALLTKLNEWHPDLIVLAGYLKKIPARVIDRYRDKIINIHPSLLPKFGGKGFYGTRVHKAVIEAGESRSGCTVHFVNEYYDKGDIIRQIEVPVFENDTPERLAKRVLEKEHQLLPAVIAEIINSK